MVHNTLSTPTTTRLQRFQAPIVVITLFAALVAFAVWGGLPAEGSAEAFWVGIAVLLGFLFGIGFMTWHFLFRPLPNGHKAPALAPMKASHRQLLAALLGICAINLVVGGFWDEAWHRLYGVPFGEDFFWRPHLMMYFGFLTIPVLGFIGMYIISRRGTGTLQQRFRANPIIGLLVMACVFLIYVLPADPIWHGIYGEDLSAWSIPHLLLFFSFQVILFLAVAIHLSTQPVRAWGSLRQIKFSDFLPLMIFGFLTNGAMLFFATDYTSLTSAVAPPFMQLRPIWVLPASVALVGIIVGILANRALRMVGVATLVGLLTVILRYLLVALFQIEQMRSDSWLLILPVMIGVDAWYAFRLSTIKRPPSSLTTGLVGALAMIVLSLPLMNQVILYPQVDGSNVVLMAMAILLISLGAAWIGEKLGDYLATQNKQIETVVSTPSPSRLRYVPIAALIASLLFIVIFIRTAAPPV